MGGCASLEWCGRCRRRGIILALVLVLPATAEANAGIGVFMVAVPFVVMATVPAILVEAPILSRLLGVSFLRGLWWSAVANVVSTLLGSFLAIVADLAIATMTGSSGLEMSRPAALVTLAPMFYLTWLLERRTVRKLQPAGSTQSPGRATLVANSVSYALLAIAVALAPSETLDAPSMQSRARLSEALAAMRAERMEIADFHEKRKRFPEAGTVATTSRHLRSLRRDGDGRVIGVIELPGVEAFHGKTLVMAPRVEGDAIVEWICYSPDATHRYMPAACRRGPPEAPR